MPRRAFPRGRAPLLEYGPDRGWQPQATGSGGRLRRLEATASQGLEVRHR